MKHTDYISYYAQHFGIDWNREQFQIHHIDGNHDNNEIDNLILLPRELHEELHAALRSFVFPAKTCKDAVLGYMRTSLNGWNDWFIGEGLSWLITIIQKCQYWGLLKRMNYCDHTGKKLSYIEAK